MRRNMKPKHVTFNDCWRQFAEIDDSKTTPVSSQYDKMHSCRIKKAYATMKIANEAAVRTSRNADVYEVYKCRWCSWFHIGHQRKNVI